MTVFSSIPDDCLYELFKYVPLKDRLRFERVSKRWSTVLDYQWNSQKVLIFESSSPYELNEWPCDHAEHKFRECDVLIKNNRIDWATCQKILSKCPTLKSLRWFSECPPYFGQELRVLCPKLEHIELDKRYSFENFLCYNPSLLTCVAFETPLDFFSLRPITIRELQLFVESSFKVSYLKCENLPLEVYQKILNKATIKKLAVGCIISQKNEAIRLKENHFKELVQKMPQLEGLRISSAGSIHLGQLNMLVEASFPRHINCPFIDFETFIAKHGFKLKHLRLSLPNAYLLDKICEYCPNLERFFFDGSVYKGFVKPINQLTKLRELGICSRSLCTPSVEDFRNLLTSCEGLKVLFLRLSKCMDPNVWRELVQFAEAHPKRNIRVIMSVDPPKNLMLPGNLVNVSCDR